MVIQRPITDLIAPFFRLEQILPLMLLAAAIISIMTLYFGLSLVVRPVHALVDYAERIGQGDFRAAAERVGGLQEIEDLRLALDHMAQRLQTEQAALQAYLRATDQRTRGGARPPCTRTARRNGTNADRVGS